MLYSRSCLCKEEKSGNENKNGNKIFSYFVLSKPVRTEGKKQRRRSWNHRQNSVLENEE